MQRNEKIEDLAYQAICSLASLRAAIQTSWTSLSDKSRHTFEAMEIQISMEGAFGQAAVMAGQELCDALIYDLDEAGGAPRQERAEDGSLVLVGGTQASHQLWRLTAQAKTCVVLLGCVNSAVEAEAHLAKRRTATA